MSPSGPREEGWKKNRSVLVIAAQRTALTGYLR